MLKPTPVTDQRQISTVERQRIIDKAFNDAMRKVSTKLTHSEKLQHVYYDAERGIVAEDISPQDFYLYRARYLSGSK